jgi:hypothetical protein
MISVQLDLSALASVCSAIRFARSRLNASSAFCENRHGEARDKQRQVVFVKVGVCATLSAFISPLLVVRTLGMLRKPAPW